MKAIGSLKYAGSVFRNIPTIKVSQDLFDDLGGDGVDERVAVAVEIAAKQANYSPGAPIIHRPFDEVEWMAAVTYPFEHICSSRLSTGKEYGVWYGSQQLETTVHETLHYQINRLISDFARPGFTPSQVDRSVYQLDLSRLLVDMTKPAKEAERFSDPASQAYAQMKAAELRDAGAVGLLYRSARCRGNNVGLFFPEGLSNPRVLCYLSYHFDGDETRIMRGHSDITADIGL